MNETINLEYDEYLKGIQKMFEHGEIVTPHTYQKICRPQHIFKKYQGIGISLNELETMIKNNITIIRIIYEGQTGRQILISTVKQYMKTPNTYEYVEGDTQKILPIKEMIQA